MQSKDAPPLGKANILKLLFGPGMDELKESIKHRRIEEIRQDQASASQSQDLYSKFRSRADEIKAEAV